MKATILMILKTTDRSRLLIFPSFNELYASADFQGATKHHFLRDLSPPIFKEIRLGRKTILFQAMGDVQILQPYKLQDRARSIFGGLVAFAKHSTSRRDCRWIGTVSHVRVAVGFLLLSSAVVIPERS